MRRKQATSSLRLRVDAHASSHCLPLRTRHLQDRTHHRTGDVFFLQDFVAYAILVTAGVLLFGLFYGSAKTFGDRVSGSDLAEESLAAVRGGEILRAYLSTRMDEPAEKFLPLPIPSATTTTLPAFPLTFSDAMRRISTDEKCLDALANRGTSYDEMGNDAQTFRRVLAEQQVPEGLCRAFFVRSVLCFRSLGTDDFALTFKLENSAFTIGKGAQPLTRSVPSSLGIAFLSSSNIKSGAMVGSQTIPGDVPLEISLLVGGRQ